MARERSKNVKLIDKSNVHNNRLQVINQYEVAGEGVGIERRHRYDVTILVNGLPLVHVELKRRGVALKEADVGASRCGSGGEHGQQKGHGSCRVARRPR